MPQKKFPLLILNAQSNHEHVKIYKACHLGDHIRVNVCILPIITHVHSNNIPMSQCLKLSSNSRELIVVVIRDAQKHDNCVKAIFIVIDMQVRVVEFSTKDEHSSFTA